MLFHLYLSLKASSCSFSLATAGPPVNRIQTPAHKRDCKFNRFAVQDQPAAGPSYRRAWQETFVCGLTANVNREVFVSSSVRTPTLIPTPECRQPSTGVSPAEVAELEHGGLGVQQQVLGLDVPVADPKRVDVGQAPEQLVHVQLHPNTHTHTNTDWSLRSTSMYTAGWGTAANKSRLKFYLKTGS